MAKSILLRIKKVVLSLAKGYKYNAISKTASVCLLVISFLVVSYLILKILSTLLSIISQILFLITVFAFISISSVLIVRFIDNKAFKKDLYEYFDCLSILLWDILKGIKTTILLFR